MTSAEPGTELRSPLPVTGQCVASPMIGLLRVIDPADPRKTASPKGKIPLSDPTSQ